MARLDGTGPMGYGPMTGRGLGPCGGSMGWARGGGLGMGWRRFYSPKNEMTTLEEEAKMLEEELKTVKEELTTLKNQQK
ncbi:MAG: DUF5320 domain-containing protein [Patescibacteria group bacterium]